MFLFEFCKWVLMKFGAEIRESHGLEAHLKFNRDLTKSLERVFTKISSGKCEISESKEMV